MARVRNRIHHCNVIANGSKQGTLLWHNNVEDHDDDDGNSPFTKTRRSVVSDRGRGSTERDRMTTSREQRRSLPSTVVTSMFRVGVSFTVFIGRYRGKLTKETRRGQLNVSVGEEERNTCNSKTGVQWRVTAAVRGARLTIRVCLPSCEDPCRTISAPPPLAQHTPVSYNLPLYQVPFSFLFRFSL